MLWIKHGLSLLLSFIYCVLDEKQPKEVVMKPVGGDICRLQMTKLRTENRRNQLCILSDTLFEVRPFDLT